MRKKRVLKRLTNAVAVEHPDGGTFFIRPMSFEQAAQFAELASKQVYERDPDSGKVLFDPKGRPVKTYAANTDEHIEFAMELLDHIEDWEDEKGEPIDETPATLKSVLTLMGTDQVEFTVPADQDGKEFTGTEGQLKTDKTIKVKRSVKENLFLWVTRKSAELASERNEIEREN